MKRKRGRVTCTTLAPLAQSLQSVPMPRLASGPTDCECVRRLPSLMKIALPMTSVQITVNRAVGVKKCNVRSPAPLIASVCDGCLSLLKRTGPLTSSAQITASREKL